MSENRNDRVSAVTRWVREELEKNADPTYREFHRSLVPGLDNFLGIRVPKLREISRKAAREDYWSFTREADRKIYEELMIRGMMIGYARLRKEERRRELEEFVSCIDNWAVCDCAVSSMRFIKKDRAAFSRWLQRYMSSDREYELRFCVVVRMHAYLTDAYVDETLSYLQGLQSDFYYVQMAVAWALATAFVPYRERVLAILEAQTLQPAVQNRTIGKICDSLRVDARDKQLVRQLRR